MALTAQPVAIGHQTLQTHRPPGGHGLGGDAHLGAKAVAETIGKAGGAVEIHAGAVYRGQEAVGAGGIPGADGIGVTRAVAADVVEGCLEVGNDLHTQNQI